MLKNRYYFAIVTVLALLLAGCSKSTDVESAEGSVSVQIPVQSETATYQLAIVNLLGISNLRDVSGNFARFFYSPGVGDSSITGQSPSAHFIKSGATFIPADFISAQMAVIYYHMQNLAKIDKDAGAQGVNHWPRSVGLETLIVDAMGTQKNNAFYDGHTDAMLFVPFSEGNLPLSVNAGIIAHEHFHSLFYKLVIQKAVVKNKIAFGLASQHPLVSGPAKALGKMTRPPMAIPEKIKTRLFNQVYIRGLNEGLADFWGWLYTNDVDFMKLSLPSFVQARSLSLDKSLPGQHLTQQGIENLISNSVQNEDQAKVELVNYYYVGTPHARFLKEWARLYSSDHRISVTEGKMIVAQKVVAYLNEITKSLLALEENELINPTHLFKYFADQNVGDPKLSKESCNFLSNYLNFEKTAKKDVVDCVEQDGRTVLKPTAAMEKPEL